MKIRTLLFLVFISGCFLPNLMAVESELYFAQVPDEFSVSTPWSQWSELPMVELEPDKSLNFSGPKDLSAKAVLAWNNSGLFIVVRVIDDVFSPADSIGYFWKGDSIQVALDPLNNTSPKQFDDDDISIGAADFAFGKRVIDIYSPKLKKEAWSDIPLDIRRSNSTVLYVLCLPWRCLGQLDPLKDKPFRFNLIVNENDQGARLGWLELSDGIGEGLDISKFRLARFGRKKNSHPQIHAITDKFEYDVSEPLTVTVTAKNVRPGMKLRVQAAHAVKERDISESDKTLDMTFSFPPSGWDVGTVPIRVFLADSAGISLARFETEVIVTDNSTKLRIINNTREILTQVENIIKQLRAQGRVVDYLQLQTNCLKYGLRVAEMSKRSYRKDGKIVSLAAIFEEAIGYLSKKGPELLETVKTFQDNIKEQGFSIPHPDILQPWSVRNGNIYVGNQVAAFYGLVWMHMVRDPAFSLNDIGLNMQTIDLGPRSYDPNSYNGIFVPLRKQLYQQGLLAQELGEVVDLHTSPHYLPEWFIKKVGHDKGWWKGWWVNTEEGRKLLESFYKSLYGTFGKLRSIKTADLYNEWTYCDTTPQAVTAFRRWLRERYGSVAALNHRWQTRVTSFENIPAPYSNKNVSPEGIYLKRGPYWDWCCFNAQRSASTVRWLNETFKENYPGLLTHIKVNISAYTYRNLGQQFLYGIDPQQILPITDLAGTDGSYVQGSSWPSTLFVYDYMKSICPDKPIYNSEWHWGPGGEQAPAAIRRGAFQLFVHGERMNVLFLLTSTSEPLWWTKGMAPQFNIGQSPRTLESWAVTSADIQRLATQLVKFASRKPSVLIFYDNAADFGIPGSDTPPGLYGDRAVRIYNSLIPWDVKVGIITEKMLADKLPSQPLIILAGAQYVSDETVEQLKRYIVAGGRILWLNNNLQFNHYGYKRDTSLLKLFAGTNRVIKVDSVNEMSSLWPKLLSNPKIDCPFETKMRGSKVAKGVEILSAMDDNDKPLVFLANTNTVPVSFQLRYKTPDIKKFTDLITGKDVDLKNIRLAGNEVMLLGVE